MPIYAWGSNSSGQLGIGHQDDVNLPTRCCDLERYENDTPKAITAGGNHTLILFESGRLISIGKVIGTTDNTDTVDITHCSANWETSTVCVDSRDVVTIGAGGNGELGRGPVIKHNFESSSNLDLSSLVHDDTTIVSLASGLQHSVAVLSNGEVLGWGNSRKGQLGEPSEILWTPKKIHNIDFKVIKAVCGRFFTFLAGEPRSGLFYICSHQDKFGIKSRSPELITGWKDVGASWGSIFVLFEDGRLLSWGRNDHGQLGPEGMTNIDQIAVGSEHALALAKDGKLYAWGWGEHGNCGPEVDEKGDVKIQEIPLPAGVSKIQGIAAGCATSWFWT